MTIEINIDVVDGLIDLPRKIIITGLAKGLAQLTSTFHHEDGSVWQSHATFDIDQSGQLDIDHTLPVAGDWNTLEPMAPVWAMKQIFQSKRLDKTESIAPRTILLEIRDAAKNVAQRTFIQRFIADGVERREVREAGLSGTLFIPSGLGPHPAVVVFNGSGGGTPEKRAALLAAHGYIGFALAYFKAPDRPKHISNTPLEYFGGAFDWIKKTLHPKNDFIAVTGQSRGGELSLLLGTVYPKTISAIVAYVPSAVVHGTLRAGAEDESRDTTAWTWQGKAIPNVWSDNPDADWTAFDVPPAPELPIRQSTAFLSVEKNKEKVAQSRIPVEKIQAPIQLISGSDDGFWPSQAYSERIVNELKHAHFSWPVEHVSNTDAGHAIGFPYVPTTAIVNIHPVAQVPLNGGGTALANARANRHTWPKVLAFLADAVELHTVQQPEKV